MARMTAADAAVAILRAEGRRRTPSASPARRSTRSTRRCAGPATIDHVLARHVEGASHMAEGYTRTSAGNIGVCIGTSGPAGTDMITGPVLGVGRLDPDPVHHRPGAGRAAAQGGLPGRRHRVDRRAADEDGGHGAGGRAGAGGVRARRSTSCARAGPARC